MKIAINTGGGDAPGLNAVIRAVLVSAEQLRPPGVEKPLVIKAYAWSKDKQRLLIFTNTQKVWRDNTRGDYWVLGVEDGTLTKLGGNAPASSLMFAKFSPDATRVAYVRANHIHGERLSDHRVTQLTSDG